MQFSCMYDFDADGEKDVLKVYRNYKINEIFYFPYLKVDFGYQNIKAKTKNIITSSLHIRQKYQ